MVFTLPSRLITISELYRDSFVRAGGSLGTSWNKDQRGRTNYALLRGRGIENNATAFFFFFKSAGIKTLGLTKLTEMEKEKENRQ